MNHTQITPCIRLYRALAASVTPLAAFALAAVPAAAGPAGPAASPAQAATWSAATSRACPEFRPDRRYGDVAARVTVTGLSCAQAVRMLRVFHDYDRDKGRYRPTRISGFQCHLGAFRPQRAGYPGRCTQARRSLTWLFVPYTG